MDDIERIKEAINREIKTQYETNEDIIKKEDDKYWAYHNWEHALRVSKIAKKLLRKLNYEKDIIDATEIACLLHDIGCERKDEHETRGAERAKKFFIDHNFQNFYRDEIIQAIRDHRNKYDSKSIITLTLILADKLDIDNRRITELGKNVEGMRQLQYVEGIDIEIQNKTLIINFRTADQFDIKEWERFYFMNKVVKAISSFAEFNGLGYEILKNANQWNQLNEFPSSGDNKRENTER